MAISTPKVGIISCSGEEMAEGTISRLATRRVLELLRPGHTVTICLPLFLAGNEAEQEFAKNHPTITVDGCEKLCAKKGTERYSGPVSASLIVSEILNGKCACCNRSGRNRTDDDKEAVWIVSEEISKAVDSVVRENAAANGSQDDTNDGCACSRPIPGIEIVIDGKPVTIAGLALIFDHLAENGLQPDDSCGEKLLQTVRIYHQIEPEEAEMYKAALMAAYRTYRRAS